MNGFSLFVFALASTLNAGPHFHAHACVPEYGLQHSSAACIMQAEVSTAPAKSNAQDQDYAKWSRMAFKEAGRVYTLLDYKYLGRSHAAPGVDQQRFRFWVKKNGHEFPLIVTIRYNPSTDKVYTITMEEEKRGNLRDL